jgi:hypothetical protein
MAGILQLGGITVLEESGGTVTAPNNLSVTGTISGNLVSGSTIESGTIFPAGHVIKTGYTGVSTVSSYSSDPADTFLTTPLYIDHVAASNGSHIYILCQFNISLNNSTGTAFKIMKDGVDISVGTLESGHESNIPANITVYFADAGTNYTPLSQTIQVMDTSGSIVKGTTYRYMLYIATLDASQTIYINRGTSWGTSHNTTANLSTIYLQEISQ